MKYLKYALVAAMALAILPAMAATDNKVKNVKGEYRYYVPRHISRDQAEQIALERAMIEGIAREFGTVVSLNTQMDMRSSKKGESVDFYSAASSLVKGEWVETVGQPKFGIMLDGDDIVITCEVQGRAREVNRAQAQLDVRVLRNSTADEAETNTFLHNDKCFLAFTTPVDGYLTVYLEDETKTVNRMLPFYNQRNSTQKVLADTRYVFFTRNEGDEEQYNLTAEKDTEHNTIYIIFSPNEFIKPVDRSSGQENGLRELSTDDFRKWLNKARALDDQLQVIPRPITISHPSD